MQAQCVVQNRGRTISSYKAAGKPRDPGAAPETPGTMRFCLSETVM